MLGEHWSGRPHRLVGPARSWRRGAGTRPPRSSRRCGDVVEARASSTWSRAGPSSRHRRRGCAHAARVGAGCTPPATRPTTTCTAPWSRSTRAPPASWSATGGGAAGAGRQRPGLPDPARHGARRRPLRRVADRARLPQAASPLARAVLEILPISCSAGPSPAAAAWPWTVSGTTKTTRSWTDGGRSLTSSATSSSTSWPARSTRCPRPAVTRVIDRIAVRTAGAAGNVALALAALGVRHRLFGAVGDDDAGRWLVTELERLGLADDLLVVPDGATGISIALEAPGARAGVPDGARRAHRLRRAATSRRTPPRPTSSCSPATSRCRACAVTAPGGCSGRPARQVPRRSSTPAGTPRSGRGTPPEVLDLLPLVDVFLPNEPEALALTGASTVEGAVPALRGTARAGWSSSGAAGAAGGRAGRRAARPGRAPVEAVDTTGAGDSLAAGVLAELAAGHDMGTALRTGVRVASTVVGRDSHERYPSRRTSCRREPGGQPLPRGQPLTSRRASSVGKPAEAVAVPALHGVGLAQRVEGGLLGGFGDGVEDQVEGRAVGPELALDHDLDRRMPSTAPGVSAGRWRRPGSRRRSRRCPRYRCDPARCRRVGQGAELSPAAGEGPLRRPRCTPSLPRCVGMSSVSCRPSRRPPICSWARVP